MRSVISIQEKAGAACSAETFWEISRILFRYPIQRFCAFDELNAETAMEFTFNP